MADHDRALLGRAEGVDVPAHRTYRAWLHLEFKDWDRALADADAVLAQGEQHEDWRVQASEYRTDALFRRAKAADSLPGLRAALADAEHALARAQGDEKTRKDIGVIADKIRAAMSEREDAELARRQEALRVEQA